MDSYSSSSESAVNFQQMKSSDFPPNILYQNRYCDQDEFSILVCGGRNEHKKAVKSIFQLYGPKLECKIYTYLPEGLYNCKTAVINSDLFVAGGFTQNDKYDYSVRKFCKKTTTWLYETQLDMDNGTFSICSFKQNLYVFYYHSPRNCSKCFVYKIKNNKLSHIADLDRGRYGAACTVFEGKIVVSGG